VNYQVTMKSADAPDQPAETVDMSEAIARLQEAVAQADAAITAIGLVLEVAEDGPDRHSVRHQLGRILVPFENDLYAFIRTRLGRGRFAHQ
jgi:hypothetical protein